MSKTPYQPTWKRFEKDANDQKDPVKAHKASKAYLEERAKEIKASPRAAQWEKTRKESIARQKPKWVKKRLENEKAEELKPFTDLKKGGVRKEMIRPMPGYVLVEPDIAEEKTEGGIVLPTVDKEVTTGKVIAVGAPIFSRGYEIHPQFKVGDRVEYKKFVGMPGTAGLEMTLQGKNYKLMRWSYNSETTDILGVLE